MEKYAIVRKPEYGRERPYNDHGRGFYGSENIDLAKGGWTCGESTDSFVGQHMIDRAGLCAA